MVLSPFLDRVEQRLQEVPLPDGVAAVTGTVKLTQVFWSQMTARFLPGLLFSVFLVWLSLAWMFRSVRLGLLALLPNIFPLVLLLALLRFTGIALKPSTAIVFSIAFGIVADDTIHLLGAFAAARKRSANRATQLVDAVREVGPALILSTIVVVTGFSVLVASRFQALALIGFLTASAALFALAADLVGFPALFRFFDERADVESTARGRNP
jgi:predicted RND superfamily exporter protein